MTELDLVVEAEPSDVAERAAHHIAACIDSGIRGRGYANVALSGGSTPLLMFGALARQRVAWDAVSFFQVDERVAPDGDPARNIVAIKELLPRAHIVPMDVAGGPDTDPLRYRSLLEVAAGRPPVLDVVHLGLGADGHTASWPPGRVVEDTGVAGIDEFAGFARMTLTESVVNAARAVIWIVAGAEKRAALDRLLIGSADRSAFPAARVRRAPSVWVFADAQAAGRTNGAGEKR